MTGLTETPIQRAILDYLKMLGVFCWRNNTQGRKIGDKWIPTAGIRGGADILGIFRGKPMAIEVKSAKGKLSEDQKSFLARFQAEGGLAGMVRSVDETKKLLETWEDQGNVSLGQSPEWKQPFKKKVTG